jgi:hypothetical protein
MAELISEIWAGLREAGLPEVMLYLVDGSAYRCHWNDTTMVGEVRVALLADQDRQIVRILPVDSCAGIGIASPKGVDPSGYKSVVHGKLRSKFGGPADEEVTPVEETPNPSRQQAPDPVVAPPPPVVEPEPPPPPRPDPLASRWGMATRSPAGSARPGYTPK